MPIITGGCSPTISITQTGTLGVSPNTDLPGGVLGLNGNFTSGTGADQLSLLHAKVYTFAASTPQTIDLQSLLDQVGGAINFSVVRFLAYRIHSNVAGNVLTVGGAGANEWNGWLTNGSKAIWQPGSAKNDGFAILQAPGATGMAVTSTSRLFKMDPGTNAVGLVDLIIGGS